VPERGFDQGFDSWDRVPGPSSSGVSGAQLTDAVLHRLEQQAADQTTASSSTSTVAGFTATSGRRTSTCR